MVTGMAYEIHRHILDVLPLALLPHPENPATPGKHRPYGSEGADPHLTGAGQVRGVAEGRVRVASTIRVVLGTQDVDR